MQDVHPTGGGGRASGDRRLRPHSHPQTAAAALKCPRCESLNTKFCYYNNYNLSQPRHFCKNCRRYWTNGGVLRNVPFGGVSRKSKRKPKPNPSPNLKPKFSTTIAAAAPSINAGEGNGVVVLSQSALPEPNQVQQILLPPEIGGFVGNSDPDPNPGHLEFSGSSTASFGEFLQTEEWDEKMQGLGLTGGLLDPTVKIDDLLDNRGSDGGSVALDWQSNDQNGLGLFDLPSTIDDDQVHWNVATTSSHDHLHQPWCDSNNNENLSLSFYLDYYYNYSFSFFF